MLEMFDNIGHKYYEPRAKLELTRTSLKLEGTLIVALQYVIKPDACLCQV